jgi:polar amino acid transport system substrate-binding protein
MLERKEALGGGVGMGFRESDDELRAKFDAAIASMKADGSLNELIAKWQVSSQF